MQLSDQDLFYLERTRELAFNGLGSTYPNPIVGCTIVHNEKIIGEGFHQRAGELHAERIAINSVKDKELLKHATLYVSLEPCNHFGKTPPCTEAILGNSIPKVVIDEVDINPLVNHSGIEDLRAYGVEVLVNKENINRRKSINKRFFTYHQEKRPYIILKWAQSADGFIDCNNDKPIKITNTEAQQLNHKWRSEEMAILIGTNTLKKDNPKLTVRLWKGNDPIIFAIDKDLQFSKDSNILQSDKSFIFNNKEECEKYLQLNFHSNIVTQMLDRMYELEIQSVIVEGGAKTINSFIELGLWDEARVFTNPDLLISSGVKVPLLYNATLQSIQKIGNDVLEIFTNEG